MIDAIEFERRDSNTDKVLALFRAHPLEWLHTDVFVALVGAPAWRTRISDARRIVRLEGGEIENRQERIRNVDGVMTCKSYYRYRPQRPLGPDASAPRERRLFP